MPRRRASGRWRSRVRLRGGRARGLLHALLQLPSRHEILDHPKLGASREGFAIEHVVTSLETRDAYFWATHGGAELDLFALKSGERLGFELKYSDAPNLTPSMRDVLEDLRLDRLWVVYPGGRPYELHEKVSVVPLGAVKQAVEGGR